MTRTVTTAAGRTWPARIGLLLVLALAVGSVLSLGRADTGEHLQVVGLGDSVMAGTNCDCDGIVGEYAAGLRVNNAVSVSAANLAVPGATSADLLRQLQDDLVTRHEVAAARDVLIASGANDFYAAAARFEDGGCDQRCYDTVVAQAGTNLRAALQLIRTLRGTSVQQVFVLDYWNIFLDGQVARDEESPDFVAWSRRVTSALNAELVAVARTEGAVLVAVSAAFTANAGEDVTSLLADDGDHPNAGGVRVIVRAVERAGKTEP